MLVSISKSKLGLLKFTIIDLIGLFYLKQIIGVSDF